MMKYMIALSLIINVSAIEPGFSRAIKHCTTNSANKPHKGTALRNVRVSRYNALSTITTFDGSNTFTQTTNFFQNSGANIQRINDRAFFGGATVNDASNSDSHLDWLSQNLINFGVPAGSEAPFASQLLLLNTPWNSTSHITATFGAQSLSQTSPSGISGLDSYCHNNNASYSTPCWAAYFDAKR